MELSFFIKRSESEKNTYGSVLHVKLKKQASSRYLDICPLCLSHSLASSAVNTLILAKDKILPAPHVELLKRRSPKECVARAAEKTSSCLRHSR